MNLADADRRKLLGLLDELARGVEGLLLGGLTAASESTRRLLDLSFQEASRLRLLRLGSTLRSAAEELGKFLQKKEGFSRKRLCFFLNRAWLLGHALARALREGDEKEFDRLLRTPANQPVERVEAVTLGVARKVVPGSFCAFDFRLRCLTPAGPIPAGGRLVWSYVFAPPPSFTGQPDAFLHLNQKQGFKPVQLLEGKALVISHATLTPEANGGRLALGEKTTVEAGAPFTDWDRFLTWDPAAALDRLRGHRPSPLDLEVELQEEVVLRGWQLGEPAEEDEGQRVYPVTAGGTTFHAVVNPGVEGEPVRRALDALRGKKELPPLFALMHYERCRLTLQPLAVFGPAGMEPLTLSRDKVNMADLLRMIKF
jgi:hypothetical protein